MTADPHSENGLDPQFVALVERFRAAMEERRFADADAINSETLAYATSAALSQPPTPELLRSLMAGQAEENGEWETARRIYEEELAEALRETVPFAKYALASRCHLQLAYVEYQQGQKIAAFELAQTGVECGRQSGSDVVWQMAVESFAGHAIRAGRPQTALAVIDQALAAAEDSPLYAQIRAQLWTRRAEASLELRDNDAARTSLALARHAIAPLASSAAAGIQATLAALWRQEARLAAATGDWPSARAAWEKAVEIRRSLAEHWDFNRRSRDSLAETIAEFAAAAESAGDAALAESLRQRLAGIDAACSESTQQLQQ